MQMVTPIASQFLTTLIEFQCSDDAQLNAPSSPQYYFSTALCVLEYLSCNVDVVKRIAAHPTLMHRVIDRLLQPDFETGMRAAYPKPVPPFSPTPFDEHFCKYLNFILVIMLYQYPEVMHPRFRELEPKLLGWTRKYRKFLSKGQWLVSNP